MLIVIAMKKGGIGVGRLEDLGKYLGEYLLLHIVERIIIGRYFSNI